VRFMGFTPSVNALLLREAYREARFPRPPRKPH
jgi:hypothetical protein